MSTSFLYVQTIPFGPFEWEYRKISQNMAAASIEYKKKIEQKFKELEQWGGRAKKGRFETVEWQ